MVTTIIMLVIAYLIGSLSSAIIVCKGMRLPDPRTQGSGNPGATNVLRIGGKIPAIVTLVGDVLKGFVPVLIGHFLGIHAFILGMIGIAAILGHILPVFFKFEGGKGVATTFGVFLALSPIVGIVAIVVWLVVALISRYSSLAALAAVVAAPVTALVTGQLVYLFPVLIMSGILIWRHLENIQRLKSRTESKISF